MRSAVETHGVRLAVHCATAPFCRETHALRLYSAAHQRHFVARRTPCVSTALRITIIIQIKKNHSSDSYTALGIALYGNSAVNGAGLYDLRS